MFQKKLVCVENNIWYIRSPNLSVPVQIKYLLVRQIIKEKFDHYILKNVLRFRLSRKKNSPKIKAWTWCYLTKIEFSYFFFLKPVNFRDFMFIKYMEKFYGRFIWKKKNIRIFEISKFNKISKHKIWSSKFYENIFFFY